MIYVDQSEVREGSLLPPIGDTIVVLNGLEAQSGADIMVSTLTMPATSEVLLRKHVEEGAILVQRKSGLDLSASVGTRMNESLARMRELGASPYQAVLLFIGVLTESKQGQAHIDGRNGRMTYQALKSAQYSWLMRGGTYLELCRPSQLDPTLQMLERKIREMKAKPTKQVWPSKPSVGQDFEIVIDARILLATLPNIGVKKAERLWVEFGESAVNVLCWLSDPQLAKVDGIGPKTISKIREWLGLEEDLRIVLDGLPEYEEK